MPAAILILLVQVRNMSHQSGLVRSLFQQGFREARYEPHCKDATTCHIWLCNRW